ncbi:MAG: glycosyltransferase [Cyanobacteria bacterium J06631_9]
MSKVSVLTITRNRTHFLKNLLNGLARSSRMPDECIVVHMNEAKQPLGKWPFSCHHHVYQSNVALPLPKARNAAAGYATGDVLLFLDVDCIPSQRLVAAYEWAINIAPDAITMGKVNYLPKKATIDWSATDTEATMRSQSKPHPKRNFDEIAPLVVEPNYGLFWSLSFCMQRSVFEQIGGFSDCYLSYGAEDTDLAWKARSQGIPLLWVPSALAFHQFHTSSVPPWHNFESIVYNAKVFYQRWNEWPMASWLTAFVEKGYIKWTITGDTLKVLKHPPEARPLLASNNR